MRKVHHPKLVQRSDRRWIVVCEDCDRDRDTATPVGINTPVESRDVALLMWENHCERRRPPARRPSAAPSAEATHTQFRPEPQSGTAGS